MLGTASPSLSYIFRDNAVGRSFIDALIEAQKRGVAVRALIDGIGSGYVLSMTLRDLKAGRVPPLASCTPGCPGARPRAAGHGDNQMTIHEELAEARDQLEPLTSGPPMIDGTARTSREYEIGVAKREIAFHEKVLARSGDGPPT